MGKVSMSNHHLNNVAVNPIVEHLNFLLYDWKREVNHPLIKTQKYSTHLIYA
jgi:hypothetical protein